MKQNSTNVLSAAIALMVASAGTTAYAQDNQTSGSWGQEGSQDFGSSVSEEKALLQSVANPETDVDLARLLKSEDYNFPTKFTDNWHVGLMVGAMNSWGSYDEEAGWLDRTNFAAALNFGKYVTPINDVRLQFIYGRGTGVRGLDNAYKKGNLEHYPYDFETEKQIADFHTYNWNTVGIAAQWLPNLTNLILGYKPDRRFTISALVGIGLEHTWGYTEDRLSYVSVWAEKKTAATSRDLVALQYGLTADLRLTNRLKMLFEVTENHLDDAYDGLISDQKWDGHLNMLVGLDYTIPSKNSRDREKSPFYDKYLPLANEIAANRDAIDNALANRQTVVDAKDVTKQVTYTLISFDNGKIEVPRLQQNNVYQTAQAYKSAPHSKIFITNSNKLDDNQFHQRAWAISKLLNQRWQIPLEDIWVDADESHIQKLQIPEAKNYIIFIINEE